MKRYLTLAVFIILLILIFAAKRERSTPKQKAPNRLSGALSLNQNHEKICMTKECKKFKMCNTLYICPHDSITARTVYRIGKG